MSRVILKLTIIFAATSCCPFGVWHVRTSVALYDDQGYGNPPPAFQVGDTVQFRAEEGFFEATCRTPAPPSDRASGLLRLHGNPADWSNPVAANQADSNGKHFLWRAYRSGVVELEARVAVFGTEKIAAAGRLEVRPS